MGTGVLSAAVVVVWSFSLEIEGLSAGIEAASLRPEPGRESTSDSVESVW